ncbi:SCO3242 family prenyltransferase [Streptomyces sp. NPDC048442]|uniref:SCO3242 family prenyltransferase n=1 Tax=Streptomyces sp. NPDC048442 TaxID=3154823 RepID=UPI003449947E
MTKALGADVRAWLELLRVSALLTVPGDALGGAAALSVRPNRGTALALASSLCLYEAGMALNDWADRAEDAQDRPHRPIPSGRIAPTAALSAACALSAAGLTLASRAGRPALAVATAVTATVWAYDLKLKHTALAPAAMATARALDLLMGAVATEGSAPGTAQPPGRQPSRPTARGSGPSLGETTSTGLPRTALFEALSAATLLGAHTYGVTEVSRHEVEGGSTAGPMAALGAVAAIAVGLSRKGGAGGGTGVSRRAWAGGGTGVPRWAGQGSVPWRAVPSNAVRRAAAPLSAAHLRSAPGAAAPRHGARSGRILVCVLAAAYLRTAARPLLHAALNPSPPLTQRAVGGGIRAMIPLQAALAARSGAPGTGVALLVLAPLARRLARKVSPT